MAPTITVQNLTTDAMSICTPSHRRGSSIITLQQHTPYTTTIPWFCSKLTLLHSDGSPKEAKRLEWEPPVADPVDFRVGMNVLGREWVRLKVPESSRWRVYRIKRKSDQVVRLSVLPNRDMSSYLSEIPDTVPLSALVLPGTHDTMAFYGWPFSQCQSLPISTQLASGIRVIDIRLALIDGVLIAYHGSVSQRVPFQSILSDVHAFLASPTSSLETIIMSIKQEDWATTPPPTFSLAVRDEIAKGPGGRGMWYLENRIPTIAEVRGKIVMLSRFGGAGDGWKNGLEGMGLHIGPWPDSQKEGFTWWCKDTLVRVHDWYAIPSALSIPEKAALATSVLLPPSSSDTPAPPSRSTGLTFLSGANIPWALPGTVALGSVGVDGVNKRVGAWLLDRLSVEESRVRGWAMMDFCDEEVVRLLVECNFRWRKQGEEGWV